MNDLKTDKKHKRLYFVLSIVSFFAPMITAIACLFPFFDYAVGYKIAIGFVLAILHTAVLAGGMWANVRLHYPMLSPLPFFNLHVVRLFYDRFLSKIRLSAAHHRGDNRLRHDSFSRVLEQVP